MGHFYYHCLSVFGLVFVIVGLHSMFGPSGLDMVGAQQASATGKLTTQLLLSVCSLQQSPFFANEGLFANTF
jgi:hypothetical protein